MIFTLAVTLLIPSAAADNISISFSDLQLGRNIDIEVYQPTAGGAVLVAQTNSTGSLQLDTSSDYVFIIRPTEDVWFQNPMNALELMKLQMPTMLSYLLWFVAVFGGVYVVYKRL
ncbi:hypothetical protein MettiDRAFT_0815 [Methanolobus tindarius DSM 2278]|uniref:Uncharacterized protein n=1 Tax=Methanolobus tindarius DSM 2278 TaxID=1090322 RepID=W9DVD2_METTI|nr:hypothetical protein MettiDRAFT_0815 [Methanolobus tindarius DSM 2278]